MQKLLLIMLSVIPMLVVGQGNKQEKRFLASTHIGFNATQIAGDDLAGYSKVGVNAGVSAYLMFSSKFSLSTGVQYSMKGSKSRLSVKNVQNQRKITLDYVEIPLLFNYHDDEKAIFGGGLILGRLVRYRENIGGRPEHLTDPERYYAWALFGTAEITFRIKTRFGINIRYEYSFTKLGEFFAESNLANMGQYSNVVGLRGMYFFK